MTKAELREYMQDRLREANKPMMDVYKSEGEAMASGEQLLSYVLATTGVMVDVMERMLRADYEA